MARARTLILDTRVNVTGEEKLGKLAKQYETAGAKVKSAFNPTNLLAGAGIALGAQQVISFFGDAVQAAGEFEDTVSATGAIFEKEAIPALEAWADKSAQAFGASKQDALQAANSMAIFGKSAGLAGQDLIDFSTELTQLGGDLASFFGGTTEDAIGAVGSALRGEFEPIRRYGVLLDAATLQQKAFELGITDSIKNALTPQQKVLAAQAAIMEQTADAQGDFGRTSEGLMNSQRTLAAELENVTIEIGDKLLPVMVELVHFVSDEGIPAFEKLLGMFGEADDVQAEGFFGDIERAFETIGRSSVIANDVILFRREAISDAAHKLGIDYMTMRDRIRRVMEQLGVDHEEAFDIILNAHKKVAGQVATILPQAIKQATSSIGPAAEALGDAIPSEMQEGVDEAVKIAKTLPGALADVLEAGIDDYQTALDELSEVAVNSVSDMTERQEIEGVLGSKALTDALNSDSTRTRLLALQFVEDRIAEYELLAPGALAAGELVVPALVDGVESNIGLATDVGQRIVDAAGNPLVELGPLALGWGRTLGANFNAGMAEYIGAIRDTSIALGDAAATGTRLRSPAEAGALSGDIVGWGRKLGEMFQTGMIRSIPGIRSASLAMGGAAAPLIDLSKPTAGHISPIGPGAGGVTQIFNLQWSGAPPKGRSESEIVGNLQRLLPIARGY